VISEKFIDRGGEWMVDMLEVVAGAVNVHTLVFLTLGGELAFLALGGEPAFLP
jgi:hypothetical protein